jgi:hypothetical protein
VIAKAGHLDKGASPRFVVTSLSAEQMAAQELYEKAQAKQLTRGYWPLRAKPKFPSNQAPISRLNSFL